MSIRHRDEVPPQSDSSGAVARIYTSLEPADGARLTVAEVSIEQGKGTTAHYHEVTEEVYVILAGEGRMRLDDAVTSVRPGDCVVIRPGVVHELVNESRADLVFVATCAPAVDPGDFYAPGGVRKELRLADAMPEAPAHGVQALDF